MKITTKFNFGDLVVTPLSARPAKIVGLGAYGEYHFWYNVYIEWPLRTENKFKGTECRFAEEDLVKA
jgi:hypothetical protein